jgi:DNA-binding beta-propeller fold protein YncE
MKNDTNIYSLSVRVECSEMRVFPGAAIPRCPSRRNSVYRPLNLICSLFLLATLFALTGCASRASSTSKSGQSPPSLVWPDPPLPPRVAYVRSISRPSDAGVKRSALTRFGNWVTGAQRGDEPLIKPFGIAVDEQNNLCVTDTAANVVCFFDRERKRWRRWEKIETVRFVSPVAVAKRMGIFFVADSALGRIIAFDERGKLLFEITDHLARPSGLAIAGDRLLVTDSQRHSVLAYNLGGGFLSEFGRRGAGPGEFNFPTHIAADSTGNLYVTDSMNGRVQVFGPNGEPKSQIGNLGDTSGHFSRPKGVALDTFEHVYVIDALFDNIQVFDSAGRFLLFLGEAGAGPGQFWLPSGVAISRENEIFVADSYNRRIQILKFIGQP